MTTYIVKIKERWDYEVEADSEAEAKAEAEELRQFGMDSFGAKHAMAIYDLGTKVEVKK
tara:strand:- start:773 stop:949 length:177 start_codon:yes stop_codon:yes gene_type:complete